MTGPVRTAEAPARPAAGRLRVASAGVGVVLALLSIPGAAALTVGVALAQLLLVLTLLVVLAAPARGGATLLGLAAAAAADAVVLRGDGQVDGLAGVVALALVAALLHQLARRSSRTRVTRSLADTLLAVVLVAGAACLPALRSGTGGQAATVAALLAAAAGLLLYRVSRAPVVGLVLCLGAGAAVGALVGAASDDLPAGPGALLGLACALAAVVGDALVANSGVRGGPGARRRHAALRPVTVLLPYAVLGPVALVAGRLAAG